jgi:hypothetical protein
MDSKNQKPINYVSQKDDGAYGYECQNPNNCDMDHFCLYLNYNGESFSETIIRASVTNIGHDCEGLNYNCTYITSGSNPVGNGCYLPWGNSNCHYARSVIVCAESGVYTGSVEFQYYPYNGCVIDLTYRPEMECDFGGIEKNDE